MISTPVPTTIAQLLAATTQATANVAKHREAMAQVAAEAKARLPQLPPAEGVTE